MDMEEILRWVIPAAIGVAVLVYMQRMMGRVGKAGVESLARFGLVPQPGTDKGGSTFEGTYRGIPCGYHWGKTAILLSRVPTQAGALTTGSELFASLGFDGPPFAIVERNDKGWKRFEGTFVPKTEVLTGHPAFDHRFSVRCEDAAWVRRVLEPAACDALLRLPLLFLVQAQQKVIFPLYFDGTRLFEAFGVPMSKGWALMDRTDTFLDAAILLVEQMQVARQTG